MLHRSRVGGERCRCAQLEQHLDPRVLRRRLVERAAQVGNGSFGRGSLQRTLRRGAQQVDRPLLSQRLGEHEMRCDLAGRHAVVGEDARCASVQEGPPRARHVVIDRGSDHRVHELQPPSGFQDLHRSERVHHAGCSGQSDLGEHGRAAERRVAPEHGDRCGDPGGIGRERCHPPEHPTRDAAGAQCPNAGSGHRLRVRAEGREQLRQQKRVADGGRMARRAELVVDVGAEPGTHDPRDPGLAQRGRTDPHRGWVGAQQLEQVPLAVALSGPRRDQQEHGQLLDAPREVDEPPERWRVRPVGIVDGDQDRRGRRQVDGQPVEPVDEGERGGADRAPRRLLDRHAEQWRRKPGGALQQSRALRCRRLPYRRFEELADDLQGDIVLEFVPASRQHAHPAGARLVDGRMEQRRLPDAGRALHQCKPAAPLPGGGQQLVEERDLAFPLQEL